MDTERGRFGTSVDDNALPASSQSMAPGGKSAAAAAAGENRAAVVAAGVNGVGKAGVHWGKNHHHHNNHHHHHPPANRSGEGEGRKGASSSAVLTPEQLHQQYLLSARPNAAAAAQRANVRVRVRRGSGGAEGVGGSVYGRGFRGVGFGNAYGRGGRVAPGATASALHRGGSVPLLAPHRSVPDAWIAAEAARIGAGSDGARRTASSSSHGWESHTLQAQQKTQEYMQGREDLAPDMRPDVVLDNEVCFVCVCV